MASWEVRVVVGDKGLSLGPSACINWDVEVVAEKGPVVDVVVVTGDSVSEPVSLGRLSLRNRLRTLELLERLWAGLSAMSAMNGSEPGSGGGEQLGCAAPEGR